MLKLIFLALLLFNNSFGYTTQPIFKEKIGNFSFTVTDFSLQVAGLPVQLNRTYSTLQKNQSSDLGYGWSLEYKNVTLQENILPGEHWSTTPDTFGIGYCFEFKTDHIVHINMPE